MSDSNGRGDRDGGRFRTPRGESRGDGRREHRGGRGEGRDRGPRREKDDGQEALKALERRMHAFLSSGEVQMDLEPMNSYLRHQAHETAKAFNISTESVGEGHERFVRLIRTAQSAAPAGVRPPRLPDFGSQMFKVKATPEGTHLMLLEDGSLLLHDDKEKGQIVDHRVVQSNYVRVRKGKILVEGEPGW